MTRLGTTWNGWRTETVALRQRQFPLRSEPRLGYANVFQRYCGSVYWMGRFEK